MIQSIQITRRTSNIGKKLLLPTIQSPQKIVQGYSSKSRIGLEEFKKEFNGSVVAGRRLMLCGLVVNQMRT
jgi:hypothetical protein